MFPEQSVRHEKISIHALREEGDTYRLVRLAKFDEFLSTPSARRATTAVRCPLPRFSISIHALREEGDAPLPWSNSSWINFYPRPPRGGRPGHGAAIPLFGGFLSTPSARRATVSLAAVLVAPTISIHALREEGDGKAMCFKQIVSYFYPRPPRGGRHGVYLQNPSNAPVFLSTPSARRATRALPLSGDAVPVFLSTPSARRATRAVQALRAEHRISIHALREEGDPLRFPASYLQSISIHALREEGDLRMLLNSALISLFLSTPSARRATANIGEQAILNKISIHALREEGDPRKSMHRATQRIFLSTPSARRATANIGEQAILNKISIHALREEGDPRKSMHRATQRIFLSTPSARRATANIGEQAILNKISIHALREEGDGIRAQPATAASRFLSTPSARRATRAHCNGHRHYQISIHALREEGDGIRL